MKSNTRQPAKHYNRIFFTLVFSVIMSISATNIVIDPKNKLGLIHIDNINSKKYFATGGRYEKSARLTYGEFDTLIAGTSRAQVGIDPKQPAFSQQQVYNAALSVTTMRETYGVLDYALQHQKIKNLIIGLDFLMFSRNRPMPPDYQDSPFVNSYSWVIPYVLSSSTFKRAIKTIKLNQNNSSLTYSDNNGFLDKANTKVRHQRRLFQRTIRNSLTNPETYGAYDYSFQDIVRLEGILDIYLSNNINIRLFISPIHATQLEAIHAMGLWDVYLQWKRDLVSIISRLNSRHPMPVALWDYSGYNSITTEPVPEQNSEIQMQWYWDASHYKKSVGNLIIPMIMHNGRSKAPGDFGVKLNQDNIDRQIKLINTRRAAYANSHAKEMKELSRLVEETRPLRTRKAKQAGVMALLPE